MICLDQAYFPGFYFVLFGFFLFSFSFFSRLATFIFFITYKIYIVIFYFFEQ